MRDEEAIEPNELDLYVSLMVSVNCVICDNDLE
jgi:hypothetical protein